MNGPVEPSADIRAMAKNLRQMYLALTMEGFSQTEALKIIGLILIGAQPNEHG
jgi:hypothetical protein